MKNMRSSLGAFVTPLLLAALVAGPTAYLALAWATPRFVGPSRSRMARAGQGLGLMVVLVYFVLAHRAYATGPWSERDDRRVADNPHWVLACSFLDALTQPQLVQFDEEFRPECLNDFATVCERKVETSRSNLGDALTAARASPLHESATPRARLAPSASSSSDRPWNVIVYVLESVGTQHLSLYGSSYDTTPRLVEEAAHSLVFDNFYAHVGVTANSLVAINLSIYPGMTWREYTVEQPDLPGTTLAQILHAQGYRTAYMTSGEIQYVNMDGFLHNRGYDLVCGYEYLDCGALLVSWGVEDRCLVDSLLRWIGNAAGSPAPFFVMAWTQQTHHPYEPSPGRPFIDFFKGRSLPPDDYDLGRYLNTLREADRQLGRLFDELRRRGLADHTLVLVTGDHGEGFGWPHDCYGHGGKVYEEGVRVPLMLWNPRLFSAGRRLDTIGGHIDLNPTLAELLGARPADSWQGHSLFDPARPPRTYFYAANDDYRLGVREHNWKYIYNATVGRDELFDLRQDPAEQANLSRECPERCLELRQRLAAWMKHEEGHIASLRARKVP